MFLGEINDTHLGCNDAPWVGGASARKEIIVNDIVNMNLDLKDKKILCLAGGIGRNANAIKKLGCHVTNSDIEPIYIQSGKIIYPDVEHIVYDMFGPPISGYDFVIIEDFWFDSIDWSKMMKCVRIWKNHATIIPSSWKLKVYKFNSELLSNYYSQDEKIGKEFIEKKFNSGRIEGRLQKSQVEDLLIEDIEINTLNPIINLEKCNSHDYQLIGQDSIGLPNYFRGLFVNNGLHMKF